MTTVNPQSPELIADLLYNSLVILIDRLRCNKINPSSRKVLKHLRVAGRIMERDFLKRQGLSRREHDKLVKAMKKRIDL